MLSSLISLCAGNFFPLLKIKIVHLYLLFLALIIFLLMAKNVLGILIYPLMTYKKNLPLNKSQSSGVRRTKLAGSTLIKSCISFLYMSGQKQILRRMKSFLLHTYRWGMRIVSPAQASNQQAWR